MPQLSLHSSSQWKNSAKPLLPSQLRLRNSFIDQMSNQSRGQGWRNGSWRGSRGRGAARPSGENMNRSLTAIGGPSAPRGQNPEVGQSSRRRRIVRRQSASPQTRWTCRRQTNANAGPNERRPRVMIRENQLYIGRTRLNPRISEHPLMTLRPVMPLRTIVDQILMDWWRARQPIVRTSQDCDCVVVLYRRDEGYCGEPTKAFWTRRSLRIHYDRGLSDAERYAAFMQHAYDKSKAFVGEGYQISGNSFDPSESSSFSTGRYREQREIDDYGSSMPTRPVHYMSDEDTSSDFGNGFENLAQD
jgi:hypothetical protein